MGLVSEPVSATGGCTDFDRFTGTCAVDVGASIGDRGVDLSARLGIGGKEPSGGGGDSDDGNADEESTEPPGSVIYIEQNGQRIRTKCAVSSRGRPADFCMRDIVQLGTPAVSLSDLVNFRPATPTMAMDPDGWALVGLPFNPYATAPAETLSGILLGLPAEVRFMPVAFHWNYGDGTVATSADGGADWATLQVPEFSETTTSHAYAARGSYLVSAGVEFAAEYRFDGQPWQGIRGTLTVSSNDLKVVAGEAKTVLVARNCAANPSGPGC
ncbi:hypothetical protein [Luethyella okanaganae]|uniref:PKD domain-containing protein n=1 Tax=Luethyella okanaganae TaxID=69372 RepID=A0ABW1VC37_9MICO